MALAEVLDEVKFEREFQDKKWGADRNHHPAEWLMILGEEVGEANKAALEANFTPENFNDTRYGLYENCRKELIQVAAVACAMIESLDRNQLAHSPTTDERIKGD